MANPNQLVEIEFLQFDVSCDQNGLLSIVDGWELMGQFFPSVEDHPLPRDSRYQEFCGDNNPKRAFLMSQNVGLIEYRIPIAGEGYTVRVRFLENPKRKLIFSIGFCSKFKVCSPLDPNQIV